MPRPKNEEETQIRSVGLFANQWEWLKARGTYSGVLRDLVNSAMGSPGIITTPDDRSEEELKASFLEAMKHPHPLVSMPDVEFTPVGPSLSIETWELIISKAAEHKMEIEDFLVKVMERVAPPRTET